MSFVPAIRDYIEMLNNVYDSLSGDINSQTIIKETLVYVFVSIKCILTYFFSFQWLRNISYFPILVPQLHFSVLNETYFLQNPVYTIFTFLETPTYGDNKLFLGFLNSFFFCLPFSCAHIICARRLLIQGLPAGLAAGFGTVLGQWWFAACILFGLRSFIIPWLSLEPLSLIVGICLLLNIIHDMTHQRSLTIITTKGKDKTKLTKIFLLNLFLSWTEQSCFFQYFGNLTFGPEPTALEIFSSNTEIQSFLIHGSYLLGLLAGSFLFTSLFGFLSIRLSNNLYPLFKISFSKWINLLNFGLISLTIAFTLTSIPYYGLDYLLTGPLGFISQDRALEKSIFSLDTLENTKKVLLTAEETTSFQTDLHSFDRGNYLRSPESSRYQSFEDLNYQGEYAWTSQPDRQPLLYRKENGLKQLINTLFTQPSQKKKSTPSSLSVKSNKKNVEKAQTPFQGVSYLDKDDIPIAELEEETKNEDDENYSLNKESVGLEKRIDEEKKENEELYMYIEDSLDQGFIDQFLTNDPESFTVLEKKIKQNYYSNPVYKFLLNINIDSFLTKEPSFQTLTPFEEKKLFEKRLILGSYYDSLRYYNQLPYIEQFQEFFDGSKSYADRVFNQQFKGTLKIVRRLFSITLDREETVNENRILKFDQPLFLKNNESQYKPFHEELSHKKSMGRHPEGMLGLASQTSLQDARNVKRKSDFLEISNSTPFYAGWDQGLRKLVITNRLLPRSYAGYALYSPTKIQKKEYRTLANFIGSDKKIKFTTWPLSKATLDKTPKSLSTIPYNVLFESIKDPKNENLMVEVPELFDDRDTYPANVNQYLENLIEKVFPPNKGNFVWPGNESLKFDFINTLKKAR